jgi:hypothetical protein
MTFLTRVITETLRLWPSVPNGTFRETEFDDVITGRDGKPVTIPKVSTPHTHSVLDEYTLPASHLLSPPGIAVT